MRQLMDESKQEQKDKSSSSDKLDIHSELG